METHPGAGAWIPPGPQPRPPVSRAYRRPVLIMGGGAVICADGSVWVFTQNAGVWGWSEDPPIPGSRRDEEKPNDLQPIERPRYFEALEERARLELIAFGNESPTQYQIEARASELEESPLDADNGEDPLP